MLKRHLVFVLLMVMAIASANAGTWKLHNFYVTGKIQNVYDMGDKVYYLNSNSLYQFDKATQTTTALGVHNMLSDNTKIKQIYYDADYRLLFITYANANIDVIDTTGKVTNISGIKDAITPVHNYVLDNNVISSYNEKSINDIVFIDGIAYTSVGYGYVCIDESTLKIISHNVIKYTTNANFNSIVILGGDLMLLLSDRFCYYGPVGEENPLKYYKKYQSTYSNGKMFPINDHSTFVLGASALYNFDFANDTLIVKTLVSAKPTSVQKTQDGFIANFEGQNYYYRIDPTGKTATKASTVLGFASSDPQGDGTVWINDANGLHVENSTVNYKLNSMTTDQPYWLKYNPAMDLLYVGVSAKNGYTVTTELANVINTYDGQEWADATAYTAAGAGYQFVFNPLDSTTYVRASWKTGLHKVTNNELKLTYNKNNSLMGTYKPHPAFDKYGNMWIVCSYGNSTCPTAVLTKDKVARNTVAKTDWFQPSGLLDLNTRLMQRSQFVISKLNNAKIYTDGDFRGTSLVGRLICWDNFNEDPTVDNYQMTSIAQFVDQTGKLVEWTYLIHLEEDADGLIWAGSDVGLFVFDPNVVFDENPKAIRPLVTNFSEGNGYLCDGFTVYDIGIDRNNNKWIASTNGLYFVSPDGTTVYEHFTTENSDIPSNTIYSVECDTKHDRVYIVTDNGFAEYISNGDAAAMNFDNVYAFPSPVEPDFTGMIKIANLMENTYVTITDQDGNVITQMGPVMGSAYWDGSGADGNRVTTGLYNIYAAQGGQPTTTGTSQATVMIIR